MDGQTLSYENYYYQRSTDGGQTWGDMQGFPKAMFGATTIQLTEKQAGTYTYRFCASHDGKHFSQDTWTLTLKVEDAPLMNFSFYVGKDYTGGYPVIKLYSVKTDAQGGEVLGEELKDCFLYSSFTNAPAEGEETYDVAVGKPVNNYQMFYASLTAGRYAYRAFAKNAETGAYDVALGGMTLDLPTDTNVDGGAGGGTNIYLQCYSVYTSSRKTDNTYFKAAEYHARVDCPIMGNSCVMGTPYTKGDYDYYPTVLYAGGNACLYNAYAYPDIDGYIFTQTINQTFQPSSNASSKNLAINPGVKLTVTVPKTADFGLYFQWNNFNTTEVEPLGVTEDGNGWTVKGDTKSAEYFITKNNGNYTWRLSQPGHVTSAGWLSGLNADQELSLTASAATDRLSHDFSRLGKQTATRDEADLQVNLDPSGYKALDGTTRVRAYRHWQLINSDAGNIMVEPDFHWSVMGDGDATLQTVNGGNTTANWADVTPGTKDSVITVYYDSVDVNPGNYGTHGGLFPATQPQRVGVIVVGGTEVKHGTADADVDFNMAPGVTTTRSMDWDYNYDTWFYEAKEENPTLDFAVKSTGSTTVEYAMVTTTAAMESTLSGFTAVTAGEDGRYSVPLKGFNTAGNGMGGTVIIKMTDETGVSYRLVRVAKVTITAENVSNPGENIMPGNQVKLSFKGMFRAVNKISGIFNPTLFKPTYHNGESKFEGTLGQYQRMDNASVTVTIPEELTFADGAETAVCVFTNGYTYGNMYSAANPFAFLYGMTDTGLGTNFNAVSVNYYINHYADAVVTVYQKVTYKTKLNITDENGKAVDGVTVTLLGRDGKTPITANEDGTYTLGYGPYTYTLVKDGYVVTRGSFSLGSADAANVKDGVLTIKTAVLPKAGENAWDGKTTTEPQKDESGAYCIGTAAELAWFAATDGKSSAKLTADIELAGYDWTPLKKFYGTFDGQDHIIRNLYINSTSYPMGLIGYLQSDASVTRLGITGSVTCTAKSNAQAGGIAGYMYDNASITQCWSAVHVTSNKHAGGIAGYTATGAVITDCYATGTIRSSAANECYLGGICGSGFSNTAGATLTNCYSAGKVAGTGGNASYVGGLSPDKTEAHYVDSFYLTDTVSGESPKYGNTGLGTAAIASKMRGLVAANEHPFKDQMLAALRSVKDWNGVTTTEPSKDASGAYCIGTAAELAWFAKAVNEGQYALNAILTADIDLENNHWTPIGNNTAETTTGETAYKGVFDGVGHVISNLHIDNADNKQGLFSFVKDGGIIRNLGVTGTVNTTGNFAGGIVGYLFSGKIENCYSAVKVTGKQNVGGIAGGGHNSQSISSCYNAGQVEATGMRVGGIVSCAAAGPLGGPKLSDCYNIGAVAGSTFVGGAACINKDSCYGKDVYYLNTCLTVKNYGKGTAKTEAELLTLLGAAEGDTLQDALFKKWKSRVSAADEEAVQAAIKAINAIPQPVTLSSDVKIIAAEKLYNPLTVAQKARVTNAQTLLDARARLDQLKAEQAAADKAAADAVIEKIKAIGTVTLGSETAIKEARAAYDALELRQKNLVKNDGALTTLEAAEKTLEQLKADKKSAEVVIGWINNLSDPITLAEEQGVVNIRRRYDSMTEAQKALVTNLAKLEKAEAQLAALKAGITAVEEKINAIGAVTLDSETAIKDARAAYEALNKEQKDKITNLSVLTAAEAEYKKQADKAAADQAAAKKVDDLIGAIGEVALTDACKDKLEAARKAYDALTAEQKKLVSKLSVLTAAEAAYKTLADKAAADQAAAKKVDDLIGDIGTVTKGSKDKIEAARKAYDALTAEQKKLISADVLKTLTDAEAAYAKLKKGSGGSGSGGGYSGDHTFTTDLPAGSITAVFVDGKRVDSKHYTVSGSDVTLTAAYLKTLRSGKQTIRIENADKVATATFTVEGKTGAINASKTGDPGVAVYFAMGAMSFLGSAAWLRKRKEEE